MFAFLLGLTAGLLASKMYRDGKELADHVEQRAECQDTVETIGLGFETATCPAGMEIDVERGHHDERDYLICRCEE